MSAPILSAYDWEMSNGQFRHLRAGFLDNGTNGKLQFRYVHTDDVVEWIDLIDNLTSVNFNFTSWWSPASLPEGGVGYSQSLLLFVNGLPVIAEWSGGITTLDSTGSVTGGITSVQSNFSMPSSFGGKNYTVGDILTITTGDDNATARVDSIYQKAIYSVNAVPTAPGTGYIANDVMSVIGPFGSSLGTVRVETVDGGGGVLTISLVAQGQGYVTGTGFDTTNLTGAGSGCTIEITEVDNGALASVTLTDAGTNYPSGASNAVPVTGGTGSGALFSFEAGDFFTITKQGTNTWAQDGFYSHGDHFININGVSFEATGGWDSLTLRGVTPDPSGAGIAGDLIFQSVEESPNSSLPGLPPDFKNDLIETFDQQLYLGSLTANSIYVSWTDEYKIFTFSIPRFTGQGIILNTTTPPRGFIIQEDQMYVSAGVNQWYLINQQNLDTPLVQGGQIIPLNVVTPTLKNLKTAGLQGALSQAFMSKNLNDVIFVSNQPVVSSLGRVDNILVTPQISDLSFPIVNDMNRYNFTDGCIFFWQNFILVAAPKENLFRMYNMTKDTSTQNPTNSPLHYWEAPLTIPLSRFSIIDGELYGHSYLVSETYKLFDGYNFNGHPIPAAAVFSYQQFGLRPQNKSENEYYMEGYISENTTLDFTLNYELDATGGQYNTEIEGTDDQIVEISGAENSLGKTSLGSNPLGGDLVTTNNLTNKFRVIKTFPRTPYYEVSPVFSSSGIDYIWSLIAFGPVQSPTSEGNNPITQ